ncbi:MAG TPA: hypothetical protein VGR43_00470, partial [Dehalococcoidia bacterium]|nr:hypothetical protein [Dehalococcoidia bacterium]
QVIVAAPELSALVSACPNLTFIVTSRELLRVQGEVEYAVPPLAQPEAVELFCTRSQLEADETIADLCRRLDNLPLAVELAAARTSVLSPVQILERLSKRLDLLKGGRGADPRQGTLRATIEWSYDLLSEEEKALFARLAVFVGGCTLEAAESVAEADLDTLQSLVDKSLVRHTQDRFWMLETIREYAAERLESSGEFEELRRRHFDFFLRLAKSAGLSIESEEEEDYDFVVPERDNLRACIDWALERDPHSGLRLAIALGHFWVAQYPFEGIRTFETLLAGADDLSADLRAAALRDHGGLVFIVGRFDEGTQLYEASLAEYRRLGDERNIILLLERLCTSALLEGDLTRARALAEESQSLSERTGFKKAEAQALTRLGDIALADGEHERGLELLERGAALAGQVGFRWYQAMVLLSLADHTCALGRREDAERWAHQSLVLGHRIGERQVTVYSLALLARAAAGRGEVVRAGRLWGAIEREKQRGPIGQWEGEREEYAGAVFAITGPEFERARDDGWRLTLDQAVEYALRGTGQESSQTKTSSARPQ